jgi:S-adenosylmethionine:tRNA ribosyltransferase-isomerase
LKTSLFDFELPERLIADHPVSPRDSARMLVVGESFLDDRIASLPSFLKHGDVLVFNDTKVLPARLMGKRGDANIEILLHKKQQGAWLCFARPAKKLKPGDTVTFADDFSARVLEKRDDGQVSLAFEEQGFHERLMRHGKMPLPPYIEKKRVADSGDIADYQTVYAKHEGSVAAPTAGLHFTDALLKAVDAVGAKRAHVTLHVGGGTFLPVKAEDTKDHVMHSEWANISAETADLINNATRLIAVGTTSLRTLESAADDQGRVRAFSGETNIFITPGYEFKAVDVLLTNFHLPKSTLFMLVSAFSGLERMQAAYAHAIAQNYRFYSYGDACLLFKA